LAVTAENEILIKKRQVLSGSGFVNIIIHGVEENKADSELIMKILKKLITTVFLLIMLLFIIFSTYYGVLGWQDEVLEEMAGRVKEGMTMDEVIKIMGPYQYQLMVDPKDTENKGFFAVLAGHELPAEKIEEGQTFICLGYFLIEFRLPTFRKLITGTHVRIFLGNQDLKVRHVSVNFEIWD